MTTDRDVAKLNVKRRCKMKFNNNGCLKKANGCAEVLDISNDDKIGCHPVATERKPRRKRPKKVMLQADVAFRVVPWYVSDCTEK